MLMAHVSYLFLLLWDFACLIYPRIGSSPPWDVPPNHLLLRAGGCLWLVPQIASALLGSILVRCLHAPVCSEVHKWLPESPRSNFLHVLLQPALASTLHTSTRIKHKLVLCVSMTGSCGYGSFRNIYCNRNNYEGTCYVNGAALRFQRKSILYMRLGPEAITFTDDTLFGVKFPQLVENSCTSSLATIPITIVVVMHISVV